MRRIFLALSLAAAPVAAQQARPDSTLPELSVVATRIPTETALAPARVGVVDALEVRAVGATTAADVLEARAPVQVRRYGPAGLATLSIRGGAAGHTTVLLDGHAVSDPQLGQIDLALLPALLIDRLELSHGAGSALHGAGALAGVLAIATPAPSSTPTAFVDSRAGAWGERALGGLASFRAGGVGVAVAASGETARDDYPYFDPNAGVSGSTVRRAGASRTLASVYARLASYGRVRATAAIWAGAAERGLPGAAGTVADQAGRQWDRHVRAWGELVAPAAGGSLRLGALVQRASLRFAGAAGDDTGRTWLASTDAEWQANGVRALSAGAQAAIATADHPSLTSNARDGRLSAWTALSAPMGPLRLYPAIRADAYLQRGAPAMLAVSPRLGTNVQAATGLNLKASAGTAFRPPTFNDRFWRYTGRAAPAGDPDLRPERGWTTDLGVSLSRGHLDAEASAFTAGARNQIVWLPAEDGFFVPGNVLRTRTRGAEVTVGFAPIAFGSVRVSADASYVFTDARDRSTPGSVSYGRPLRYIARHAAGSHAALETAVGTTGLRLDVDGRVLGSRPTRADGGAPLPVHVVLDARARLARRVAGVGVELGAELKNLTNTRYAVVEGYPMPPRHGRLTLRLSF